MKESKLLTYTDRGLYCPVADVYIDPHKPVKKALITHGHSDHALSGHRYYLCTALTAAIIKFRLGSFIQTQVVSWGEILNINGVSFSFHPAGHIPGSAQIKMEYHGEIIVITGDYKTEEDQVSGKYELIKCKTLVTETTFALPIYQWQPQQRIIKEILDWYQHNLKYGKSSVVLGYALGKSQRIIQSIPEEIPVFTHAAVENTNKVLRQAGLNLRKTYQVSSKYRKKDIQLGITVAPSAVLNTPWIRSLDRPTTAFASGWMALSKNRKAQAGETGFALSDHVDWNALNSVVDNCDAENIWLMHGFTDDYEKYLAPKGYHIKNIGSHFSSNRSSNPEIEEEED